MLSEFRINDLSSKGKVTVSFEGNIYGHESEDKRVVLNQLYKSSGIDFVRRLRGDFAITIGDYENRKIMLARDQAGHKRLYYFIKDDTVIFSSDVCDILNNGAYDPKINLSALNYLLDFRFIPSPMTMFEGIYEVPPGSIVTIKDGKATTKPYWEYKFDTSKRKNEKYYAERLYELMEEAVRIRLDGEGDVGAFLSGGLDSGTLVGLMSKINKRPIKTFTAGFSESDFDESPYAQAVADYYGVEHHKIMVKPSDLIDFLPKMILYTGQPFYDSTAIATYYVAKLAKEHVDTVLDAHGPDQQLASFDDYVFPIKYRLRNILTFDLAERIILNRTLFKNGLKEKLFNFPASMAEEVSSFVYSELKKVRDRSLLEKILYWDCTHSVPDNLMLKLESMVRPHNLDVRNPFLDVKVMEFIATIPADLKLRMVYNPIKKYLLKEKPATRYIMKKAFKSLLPEDTLKKKKQHFSVPLKHWMRNQLKDYTCDILLSEKALHRDYLNGKEVKTIVKDFYGNNGSNIHYGIIWTLLLAELWNMTFID